MSPILEKRRTYQPRFPSVLNRLDRVSAKTVERSTSDEHVNALFPHTAKNPVLAIESHFNASPPSSLKVGVVLSGGQAPGGHNVICGLFDAIKQASSTSQLIGFRKGPGGILADDQFELNEATIDSYRNTGGFDMLGSGRTKLETVEQFSTCQSILEKHEFDGLVVIGGDDSNTNAALLAEHLAANGSRTRVVGVPKTIDGDLKNQYVDTSFGFDTAAKVYSELVSNIAIDARSARKYYHFIRLMGRSASHITLETALQTQPNIALISEEIASQGMTLEKIADQVGRTILQRSEKGMDFGVVLVPEGLIEFVPEMKSLISQLNELIAEAGSQFEQLDDSQKKIDFIRKKLAGPVAATFDSLPAVIQAQLLDDRDPHGNVQVSRIETERLLVEMVAERLTTAKKEGTYRGKFSYQRHFLGYEGRCAAPSNFDADYAYSLGRLAAVLLSMKANGYMSVVGNLGRNRDEWEARGVPLTSMITTERRKGEDRPVIAKGLVDLAGKPFQRFAEARDKWALGEDYRFAGPIQYFGDAMLTDQGPLSLHFEQQGG